MTTQITKTIHAGRVLLEEFLAPRGVSVWHLARDIGVPTRRVYDIVQGQRAIDTDIAHRLAHYFGMSERYWLDLQARYDEERERSILGKFRSKPTFLRVEGSLGRITKESEALQCSYVICIMTLQGEY